METRRLEMEADLWALIAAVLMTPIGKDVRPLAMAFLDKYEYGHDNGLSTD